MDLIVSVPAFIIYSDLRIFIKLAGYIFETFLRVYSILVILTLFSKSAFNLDCWR